MTTDIHHDAAGAPLNGSDPIVQALMNALSNGGGQAISEVLRNGKDGAALLKSFLSAARLTAEQQSVIDLILAMQGHGEDPGERPTRARDDAEEAGHGPAVVPNEADDIRNARNELADLRQVNDTVAAALGACRYCWGGDRKCDACGGRGRAGSAAPDPELFQELVTPAVRRVWTTRRAGFTGRARNRR